MTSGLPPELRLSSMWCQDENKLVPEWRPSRHSRPCSLCDSSEHAACRCGQHPDADSGHGGKPDAAGDGKGQGPAASSF